VKPITIDQLKGGPALCAWFEGTPSFHDARLSCLELRQGGDSRLVAHIFRTHPEVGPDGYYMQSKRAAVTFTLFKLAAAELEDIMEAGILYDLRIEQDAEATTLHLDASYGVHGWIKARRVAVKFLPEREA